MIVQCTCGKKLRVADEAAGRTVKCPTCRELIKVPQAETEVAWAVEDNSAPDPTKSQRGRRVLSEDSTDERQQSSNTLLRASKAIGALAVIGFIVSGLLLYLGNQAASNPEVDRSKSPRVESNQRPNPNDQRPAPKNPDLSKNATVPPNPAGDEGKEVPAKNAADEIKQLQLIKDVNVNLFPHSVSLSSDGRKFIGPTGKDVTQWDLTGKVLLKLENEGRQIGCALYLPGEREILVGRFVGSIEVIDLEKKSVVREFMGKHNFVSNLRISSDGKYAFSSSPIDKHVIRWEIATGRAVNATSDLRAGVQKLAISPSGNRVLFDVAKQVHLWEPDKGSHVRELGIPAQDFLTEFVVSPDGKLALLSIKQTLVFWDLDENKERGSIALAKQPTRLKFAPDGRRALVAHYGFEFINGVNEQTCNAISLIDVEKREVIKEYSGQFGHADHWDFTADCKRGITVDSPKHTVHVLQFP